MQRLTTSIDDALAEAFDALVQARGYQNRSEGMRDLVREAVKTWRDEGADDARCVAALSYRLQQPHARTGAAAGRPAATAGTTSSSRPPS